MAKHIFLCQVCDRYTMQKTHCDKITVSIKPPKYSPDDKYSELKRSLKKEGYQERGLLE